MHVSWFVRLALKKVLMSPAAGIRGSTRPSSERSVITALSWSLVISRSSVQSSSASCSSGVATLPASANAEFSVFSTTARQLFKTEAIMPPVREFGETDEKSVMAETQVSGYGVPSQTEFRKGGAAAATDVEKAVRTSSVESLIVAV
eukprot:TRINITY_DN2491_c0_g3_i1.p3 TRINITY_DN2491_c0_g3~~TRINITY_DN2491_c0_g3_i1.p3  ORF type:complete len:147 (-),score=1.46 TRINITY_DN2491_c0_g3_i1:70-510(-)